jgi:hypothetical protein
MALIQDKVSRLVPFVTAADGESTAALAALTEMRSRAGEAAALEVLAREPPRDVLQAAVRYLAEVGNADVLRTLRRLSRDEDATLRLHVLFVPQENGAITVCFSLATRTAARRRYVTDNLYIPFGGFYPESWHVERSPWRRSLVPPATRCSSPAAIRSSARSRRSPTSTAR